MLATQVGRVEGGGEAHLMQVPQTESSMMAYILVPYGTYQPLPFLPGLAPSSVS